MASKKKLARIKTEDDRANARHRTEDERQKAPVVDYDLPELHYNDRSSPADWGW